MPKVDGLEVLRQMKSDQALSTVPVIMLTSSREEKDLVISYRSGANAYVVKPMDFGEFMKAVTELSIFWAAINEPPPNSRHVRSLPPSDEESHHDSRVEYPPRRG